MDRRDVLLGMAGLATAGASALSLTSARAVRSVNESDRSDADWYSHNRQFADSQFGRIAYVKKGSGPAALFLHGFPLSSFQWRGAIERLSKIRTCIAPDFMGLGHNEVAEGQSVDPSAQTEMIYALLDKLGMGTVDIIANDSGGAIAQLFLIRHADRVRSLLLTNCDVETDSPPPALLPVIELAEKGTYPDDWLAPWFADKDLARSAKGIGGMCYSNPQHPTDAAIEMYFGPILRSARTRDLVNAYTIGLKRNPLEGAEPLLRQRKVPAAIVWGMGDTIFSSKSPDYLQQVLPNLRSVRRLPKAKLFFPEEYPEVISEEAQRLWAA